MNLVELQRKLLAAARSSRRDDRVPYAFERRIMARVRSLPVPDPWDAWAGALWRAAVPCVAISLLLGAWTFLDPSNGSSSTDLSQEIDNTVLAALEQEQPPPDSTR
jgi:hypothetical protein